MSNQENTVVVEERKWDTFSACMVAEGVDEVSSEEEYLSAWQYLVDTGVVWSLQGFYGRTAAALIEAGHISPATK
jgi:hypothetical protein